MIETERPAEEADADSARPARTIPAIFYLGGLALRRQFFSRQTLICVILTGISCLIVLAWTLGRTREGKPRKELTVRAFAERIIVPVHASFLVPMFAICYGASSVATEREDRTLIYLLMAPLPRPLVYLAKHAAATLLVLAWTVGSLLVLASLGGPPGREAAGLFWPALTLGALAYTSLFHALGAIFRRGTIVSLAYAFFLEILLGNMPGIAKRASISFYLASMLYDAGAEHRIGPQVDRALFLPITGPTASLALALAAAALFVIGMAVFTRREYRDLA